MLRKEDLISVLIKGQVIVLADHLKPRRLPDVVMSLHVHLLERGLLMFIGLLASVRHFQHYAPLHLQQKIMY